MYYTVLYFLGDDPYAPAQVMHVNVYGDTIDDAYMDLLNDHGVHRHQVISMTPNVR